MTESATCFAVQRHCVVRYSESKMREIVQKIAKWMKKEGLDEKQPMAYNFLAKKSKKLTGRVVCNELVGYCDKMRCKYFKEACDKSHADAK